VDRQDFLKTLAEACQKSGSEVHGVPVSWGNGARTIRRSWRWRCGCGVRPR
jgi:hypothetical protein